MMQMKKVMTSSNWTPNILLLESHIKRKVKIQSTKCCLSLFFFFKMKAKPARIWCFFEIEAFVEEEDAPSLIISKGNFCIIGKATFKDQQSLEAEKYISIYADKSVIIKDERGYFSDFLAQQDFLSYEISCNLILHPNIINYIGGVLLGKGTFLSFLLD